MATYQVPGVYKRETILQPPRKLLTGIPAFLGIADSLEIPVNHPQPLTDWSQFEQYFGQRLRDAYFAYAVRGFFENGGQQCYGVRLRDTSLEALQEGLAAIEAFDPIDLVCVPDATRFSDIDLELFQRMQVAVLDHCSRYRDRFAILDSLPQADLDQVLKQRQALTSAFGALYYPWIRIPNGPSHNKNFVPPCGHIAGIYARSDDRIGVHKAPANETLDGVFDVEVNLSNAEHSELNPAGINGLRIFPGYGIQVWGARTLSSDPEWCYINVRRLFITVERWIEFHLTHTPFEPNSSNLWASIQRDLTAYLNQLFQQGALKGASPAEAFYVKCDAETNLPETRDLGQVLTEIGLAPAIPGEFIVVHLTRSASGFTLSESMSESMASKQQS